MKTSCLIVTILAFGVLALQANPISTTANQTTVPAPTAPQVVARDANSKVWQWQTYEQGRTGKTVTHIHSYTELATGLNYQQNGQWTDSKEEIDILPNGTAAATQGQHQAYFPGDIYQGQIELVTPDGLHLQSRPLGLSYDDGTNTVMIAVLTNSTGQLLGTNQVIYPNAFTGLEADLIYTYTKAGFEQDIVLRQQPPTPESLGLNPDTAKLQVFTEFFDPPQPAIRSTMLPVQAGISLPDESLGFGQMQMVPGKAFVLGTNSSSARVGKQWVQVAGRQFLIEEVPVDAILEGLAALPSSALNAIKPVPLASKHLALPPQRLAKNDPSKTIRLAKAGLPAKGFVLDYQTINGSVTNYTFQGDTTYYISGTVYLNGTNTLEGGTVLKYATNGGQLYIYYDTTVQLNCSTTPYRPAIFTAQDDNSIGETISGSTGNPIGYYGNTSGAIDLYGAASSILRNLRMSYLYMGISYAGESNGTWTNNNLVADAQFIHCGTALWIDEEANTLLNCLIAKSGTALGGYYTGIEYFCENTTIADTTNLQYGGPAIYLTNCLVAGVGNTNGVTGGANNQFLSSASGVFQTVGGGSYYLATNSIYRSAGTTNIDPTLLVDLQTKTTYPPVVYFIPSVYFYTNLNLFPQAQRDTNASPDLGYHYNPLDYLFGPVFITNATITVNPGTVIGIFGTNYDYGFSLSDNSQFVSQGAPNNLNRLVEYNTVQEQTPAGWIEPIYALVTHNYGSQPYSINCRFTDWSVMAQDASHIQISGAYPLNLSDCQFHGGSLISYYPTVILTNCLLERVNVDLEPQDTNTTVFRNNTIFGGTFGFGPGQTNSIIMDNLFDSVSIPDWLGGYGITYIGGHNAFVTNCDRLDPTFASDVILIGSPQYQVGTLGNYYLPTNSPLINMGSTTADQVGLYHFTTQTNQMKETNSIVDIGYHYVATDAYGNPIDSNGDGIPDYLADANGNGIDDPEEIPWNLPLTNLVLWLKADVGVTNSGGAVSTWSDQSGHGNNATQTSGANQPQLVTNVINGLPVVRFDGTSSYFSLPNFISTATGAEVFVVVKSAVTNTLYSSLWQIGSALANNDGFPCSDGSIGEDFGSTTIQSVGIPSQPLTQFNVYEASSVSTNWAAWLNGAPVYQTTNNTVGFTTTPSLGYYYASIPYVASRQAFFWGDIAEIMIFNRGLTSSERLAVQAYLDDKYELVPPVPVAPSNLVATAVSPTQIGLTWDEAANWNLAVVNVERSTSSNGVFSVVAQLANATSYIDTNLTAGTVYFYRVQAISWTQQLSPYSGIASTTTPAMGTDLPFGSLALWLKADAGLAQGSTNTPVALWADQSGNGDDASPPYNSNQPLWVPGAMGDRPVVRFNGMGNCYLNLSNFLGNTATAAEAFIVLKVATNASFPVIWQLGNDVGWDGGGKYPSSDDGSIWEDFGSPTLKDEGIPAQSLTQSHLYEVASQNNNYTAWINGAVQFHTNYNVVGFRTFATLGKAQIFRDQWTSDYFTGDIAEVLVFNRALASDEEKTVGSYLVMKYNLSLTAVNNSTSSIPTGLLASGVAPYKLSLSWDRTSTNESGFRIERKLGTSGIYQEIGSTAAGVTNFVDITANATNQYFYRVTSFNYFGESGASSEVSPPTVQLTNWPANIFEKTTNVLSAQASDAVGTVSNVQFFADYTPVGTAFSAPYTINWFSTFEGTCALSAMATDSLGNSQFSSAITVTAYLDSNGDGTSDVAQVLAGNDPLNPWVPPTFNTNDHTAPIITLLIPTNAVIVP